MDGMCGPSCKVEKEAKFDKKQDVLWATAH